MQESCKRTCLSRWQVSYKPAGPHLWPHLWGNAVRGRRQSVELPAAEWCSKARIQQQSSLGAEQKCSLISLLKVSTLLLFDQWSLQN